jgi:hypothetical protein
MEFFGLKSIDDLFEDDDCEEVIIISDSEEEETSPKKINHRKSMECFNKRMSIVNDLGEDPDATICYEIDDINEQVITEEQKQMIRKNKLEARRRLLNGADVGNFSSVPEFIVDSFFDEPSYKKRLIVSAFCFLNGIAPDCLESVIHWSPRRTKDHEKCVQLYAYFSTPDIAKKYWSYHVSSGLVRFLDGSIRNRYC